MVTYYFNTQEESEIQMFVLEVLPSLFCLKLGSAILSFTFMFWILHSAFNHVCLQYFCYKPSLPLAYEVHQLAMSHLPTQKEPHLTTFKNCISSF